MKNYNQNKGLHPVSIDAIKMRNEVGKLNLLTIVKTSVVVFLLFILGLTLPVHVNAQTLPNEALWSENGWSLKKVVSNTTIASGVNFSYTIIFTAPAGVSSISIQDLVPAGLQVVSVTSAGPVCTVTPVTNVAGNLVTYNLTGLPGACAPMGSFTIVVKFPEGTTCNGATARNKADILVNDKWQSTPYVSTSATAVDPWVVSKSILGGAQVNPSGGSCGYIMEPGDTVTYRLSVMKNSPYYGNVVGQMNMSGATVTDVLPAGAVLLTSTCGIPPNSTGTITWQPNSGNLNAATAWAYYYCDITVYYPAGSFPATTIINNQLSLSGTICNQPVTHTSNITCIEVKNIVPLQSGYFQKYISLTNRVPGCTGVYTIVFCNNGNVPLSAFNITDAIPTGITVNQVGIWGANGTTSMNLNINGSPYATGINAYYNSPPLTGVTSLQFQMASTLPVGGCIYMYIYFTVNPNPTGTIVTNCATFNGLSNTLTLPQACVPFTVEAGAPKPCVYKDICSPQASYVPGDIIRFRLRVQNIGSAAMTGATIQDVLNTGFTYVGNESYFVSNTYSTLCSVGSSIPAGATAWSGVTPSHSGSNLQWNIPSIASDCQLFYSAYCGYYGTYGIPYHYIEFDVKVDSLALPGITTNLFNISGGNLSGTTNSNIVNVLVTASFGQEVTKLFSTDNGATFVSSGTAAPGSTVKYRLNYKNTSNVPVSSIMLVDLLPKDDMPSNDWLIFNRTISRGSQFSVSYVPSSNSTSLLPVASPPTPLIQWAPGNNICLPPYVTPGSCSTTTWGGSPTNNIRMDYSTFSLVPAKNLREDFNVLIPVNAVIGEKACNDFAAIASANFLLNGSPQSVALTPVASPPVCLTVGASTACCDSVKVERAPGANGVIGCCARITTKCDVDSIVVNITNGTISGMNWNCAPAAPGFIGQSNYTFNANACVLDMTLCIDPAQSGVSIADFTIYFSNGDTCKNTIDLDCTGQTSCCDSIDVRSVQDPTNPNVCCAEIISKCDVDSISVSVLNGTLSSASWNCGPIPAGYVGQSSYTFNAGGCMADLVTCVNAIQTGVVTINYVAHMSNGEKCDGTFKLDCKGTEHCCDSVDVKQVVNSDGTVGCCAEISTKCEVDSINVSLVNGTFSSNNWNCASPIPVAAIGQSSYTFVASNCVVNMTNCFKADQSGVIIANYTVYFSNGEKCEKILDLDCEPDVVCCDSIDVRAVQDAANPNACCAEIISKCDVDSISVSVLNGTLSSASWNCGPIPAGYVGQSSYTFNAGGCMADLVTCVNAKISGIVTINYVVYMSNGEKCEKSFKLDCKASTCCEKTKLEKVVNSDGTTSCCVKLTTECEVKSVNVAVTNGTIASAVWNCGALPTGYVGSNNFTFNANGCVLIMTNCFNATQTGVVTVTYTINYSNGEVCKKTIELDCKVETSDCCVLVDFNLKQKWPNINSHIGTFAISNADPSSPICSVTISTAPSASFTTAGLVVDGVPSSQPWNSTSIPVSGNLSPAAVNSIVFSLVGVKYKGLVTVCVVKCDGSKCCFDFKWNGKPFIDIDISTGNDHLPGKVVAVSVNPVVETDFDGQVKYVSFGMSDEGEVNRDEAELFAISATEFQGEEYPEFVTAPMEAYMSKSNAYFVLAQPKSARESIGNFNLVFSKKLPKLGCTLFDVEGNVIYSGNIEIKDTVSTAVIQPGEIKAGLFEFINLYPNPSNGEFRVTYATGSERDIEIRVVNPIGQVVKIIDRNNESVGIHNVDISTSNAAAGLYKVVLYSEGQILSKSAVLKE